MDYKQACASICTNYIDLCGVITQRNGDPGDTASRIGIYHYLRQLQEPENATYLSESFEKMLIEIEIEPGTYIRHPHMKQFEEETYVYDPNEFSRDQTMPIIVALGEYPEQKQRLKDLIKQQKKRFLFKFQNKDFFGPLELSAYIRATKNKWLTPLLLLSDIGLLVNAIIRDVKRDFDQNNTSDDVVLSLLMIQAYNTHPTPLSWLARQLYRMSSPMHALESYFSYSSSAPPLAELYRPIMNKIL